MYRAYEGGAGVDATDGCGDDGMPPTVVDDDDDDELLGAVGADGAMAVCKTGFCTCVDLTDCMMMGECVFVCHVPRAVEMAMGRCMAGCGEMEFCETVIGLGEPADVAE